MLQAIGPPSNQLLIALDKLHDAPKNANRMEPSRYEALRASIAKRGFLQPILVRACGSFYEIVDGHHRVRAVKELNAAPAEGYTPLNVLPATVMVWTEQEAAIEAIGMNRRRGELDLTEVGHVLHGLQDTGWADFTDLGFTNQQIDTLLSATATEDVAIPPMPMPEEEIELPTEPFVLEITFMSRSDYQKAKRGLKRAAGKGNDLSIGLLRLLSEEVK